MSADLKEHVIKQRKPGRPKGEVTLRSQRMLETWDALKRKHPTLNKVALLNLTANSLFGERTNIQVKRRETNKLKRTLQRHGRY